MQSPSLGARVLLRIDLRHSLFPENTFCASIVSTVGRLAPFGRTRDLKIALAPRHCRSTRKIESTEDTILQHEAVLDSRSVNADTNDFAAVVDIEGVG